MSMQDTFSSASDGPLPQAGSNKSKRRTRDCPRVTVRLSPADHAKLKDLADGVALSTYLRAAALRETLPRRHRGRGTVEDKEAIARVLALLGQSRIANNLNQLAYHANIGALEIDDRSKQQIEEAYQSVVAMRADLLKALGFKS